jgi:purine-nucleoside phosphorylase
MSKKLLKRYNDTADWLRSQYPLTPEIGIILGSGLGNFIDEIRIEKEIPYEDIPHFPVSTVKGHTGKLVFGKLSGKTIVAMSGRFHYYEGYKPKDIAFPIRLLKLLGVKTLLLSNAAGAVNPTYRVGDIMIITDHISFFIPSPLVGKNIDEFGPRFPDMGEAYNRELVAKARAIGLTYNFDLKEGVYVAVSGPAYETRAEYRFIRVIGGDVVGMSTVQEALVARHMDMNVFAVSVVTDLGLVDHRVTHEQVLKAAAEAEPKLALLFKELVAAI